MAGRDSSSLVSLINRQKRFRVLRSDIVFCVVGLLGCNKMFNLLTVVRFFVFTCGVVVVAVGEFIG